MNVRCGERRHPKSRIAAAFHQEPLRGEIFILAMLEMLMPRQNIILQCASLVSKVLPENGGARTMECRETERSPLDSSILKTPRGEFPWRSSFTN